MQSWRVRLQHATVAEVLRTIFIFKKYQKLYSNKALEHIYTYIYTMAKLGSVCFENNMCSLSPKIHFV